MIAWTSLAKILRTMYSINMKNLLFVACCLLSVTIGKTQSVGIGNESPDSSAILDLSNLVNKGLLIPSMTTAEKNSIDDPADGLLVYQTDSIPGFYFFDGIAWGRIGGGGNAWEETDSTVYTSKIVGIGNSSPDTSAILDLSNPDNKGVLIPSMTTGEKNSIDDPADGLLIYQTDSIPGFYFFDGTAWGRIGGGGNAWEETDSTVYTSKFVGVNTDAPYNHLDVHGNMVITQPTITTATPPTPALTKIMINNLEIAYQPTDSTGRFFDPGGPNGQYGANISNSICGIYENGPNIGIELTIEQIDLGVGDSLIIRYENLEGDIAYALGHQNSHAGIYIINAIGIHLLFKSDANPATLGDGFSILFKRLYPESTIAEPNGYAGHSLIFDASNGSLSGGKIVNNSLPGEKSLNFGNYNSAVGITSIAIGGYNNSTGQASISLGHNNTASGNFSASMGQSNSSLGSSSFTMGYGNNSVGSQSISMGYENLANTESSVAIGHQNNSTGLKSISLGSSNITSGDYTHAFGRENNSIGSYSTSIGFNNSAEGYQSCAFGSNNITTGFYSTTMGLNNLAEGDYSIAIGYGNISSGDLSSSQGTFTKSNGYSGTVVGMYNSPILTSPQTAVTEDTPLFIIGNGSGPSTRSNAMVVRKDGNVGLGTNNPRITLHIADGTDAGLLDDDGFLLIGNANGVNLVMDDNEIIARDNAAISDLYLQKDGGKVFIGAPVSPSFLLSVNGTAGKNGGGSWSTYSDRRLKQNVHTYSDGLDEVLKINPVWFQYNSMSGYDTKEKYVGVIAQELQEVSPYMVTTPTTTLADGSTGYLQVDNSAMTYLLINAVKELHAEIENLKSEIKELRKAN